jgi:PKD repeat protein
MQGVRFASFDGAQWNIRQATPTGDQALLALDALDRPHIIYGDNGLHHAWLAAGTPTPPLTYTWDLGDGHAFQGELIEYIYTQPGTYTVILTATNCQGEGLAVATHTLLVAPCEPVHDAAFSWTPLTPTVNQWTSFHASAEGGAPIVYNWAFGDGGYGHGANVSHRYTDPGVYTVLLTATNCVSDALTVAHTLTVVALCEPVHDAGYTWTPLTPTVGEVVAFTAGTEPLTFSWDFGDGGTACGATTTHTFGALGGHTVTVSVTNPCGLTAAIHMLEVCRPPWRIYLPLVVR